MMAFEPGGHADKLGNRYERKYVLDQLLSLLREQLQSVTVEPSGDDGKGVDLVTVDTTGVRRFIQCKSRNGDQEKWSVNDLKTRHVLETMKFQFDRDGCDEFWLVSGLPATNLMDMCNSARERLGPEEFWKDSLTSNRKRGNFKKFCEAVELNPDEESDRRIAYHYLQRIRLIHWMDDDDRIDNQRSSASFLIDGSFETTTSILDHYAAENLRRPITAHDLWEHLAGQGHCPRRLAHDTRVMPAIVERQRRFNQSIRPDLIENTLLHREETDSLFQALESKGVVFLHGTAGVGKSGVLYELTQRLKEANVAYIPIRLDRMESIPATPAAFGKALGLPESPARCLEAVAGGNAPVLILDQLDALRWTARHSAAAMDTCKALVREILELRKNGTPIAVVLACRTFDLKNDPAIEKWLDSLKEQCAEIEVNLLPEATVNEIVRRHGEYWTSFSNQQKKVLCSPHYLSVFCNIAQSGHTPTFSNGSQLITQFWRAKYDQLQGMGFDEVRVNALVETLVGYMDGVSKISAPNRLASPTPRLFDALRSCGLLTSDGQQISFCHQSYLDNRIARKLMLELDTGSRSVLDWLGDRSRQTLFRREQLRQILVMLADESPNRFLTEARRLLESSEIRFHLKHLVLEVMGQIDTPSPALFDYLKTLLEDPQWEEHLAARVFPGNVVYLQWLMDEGTLATWMESEEYFSRVKRMLWRPSKENDPDVAAFLEIYCDRDESWDKKVLSCLPWSAEDDSDELFEIRLRLLRRGIGNDHTNWKALTKDHALRAIGIMDAILSTWTVEDIQSDTVFRQHIRDGRVTQKWDDYEQESIRPLAQTHPKETWDSLVPHIQRLSEEPDDGGPRFGRDVWWPERDTGHGDKYGFAAGVVDLVTEAGLTLARTAPAEVSERLCALADESTEVMQRIVCDVYAAMPVSYSDNAIEWLLADSRRLALGHWDMVAWKPAAELISAHSPHGDVELYEQLEETLIHYIDPSDRQCVKSRIGYWQSGCYDPWWGRPQHFLLPALCKKRRSLGIISLVGVLGRTYAGWPESRFIGHWGSGFDAVTSPLSRNGIHTISDDAWLKIVTEKEGKIPEEKGRWKSLPEGGSTESSVRMFSQDLRTAARRHPNRFGQLAISFPLTVHPHYVDAILDGLSQTKPPGDMPEGMEWEPATQDTVLRFVEQFRGCEHDWVERSFCDLVEARPEHPWNQADINRLVECATSSSDPEPRRLNRSPSDDGPETANETLRSLYEKTLNCTRGRAARAIASLLFHDQAKYFPLLKDCVHQMLNDPHPVVRIAAANPLLAVWNSDKSLAVQWFAEASTNDLRVPASPRALPFFNCAFTSHQDELIPIIQAMVHSDNEEVANQGALQATARWLFHGVFEEEVIACRDGTAAQRKGVAEVAAQLLFSQDYPQCFDPCRGLLDTIWNDEEKDVRDLARRFRKKAMLDHAQAPEILNQYVQTDAFHDAPGFLLLQMKKHEGSLIPFAEMIIETCRQISSPASSPENSGGSSYSHDMTYITPLLLRLYDQTKDIDDAVFQQCLDAWDILFESPACMAAELTKTIDAG